MTRSSINSYQKSGSLVPELNYELISQTDVDGWTTHADLTNSIIPFSQFKTETGYTGKHPLENMGQTNVLKVVVNTSVTTGMFVCNDLAVSEFLLANGLTGMFVYYTEANRAELYNSAAPGVKLWALDGSISDYRAWDTPVINVNTSGEWNLVGGIDDNAYDIQAAGTPTLIDLIRINVDTNAGDPTFYLTSVFSTAKRRPTIMFEQDDINEDTTEFFADLDTYGLKGASCGVYGNMDLSGRPTQTQMKAILDNGHAVYAHGADGLRTDLASDSDAFIAQWESELALWRAFYPSVLDDTMLLHGALPLSENDETTREWMRGYGFKTMRRTGTTVKQALIAQPGYADTAYLHLPGWGVGAESAATLRAAVDKSIETGNDLCIYLHRYITDSSNRAGIQALMEHVKLRVDQGLCECMPRHEWYEKSIAQYGDRSVV